MIKRVLINGLLISGIQVLLIYVLLSISWYISMRNNSNALTELALLMGRWIFTVLVLFSNLISAIVNRKRATQILSGLVALIYILCWVEDFTTYTIPTLLVMFSGVISVLLGYYLHLKFSQSSEITTETK